MNVIILDYIEDVRNWRLGFVDIKVVYNAEKWEIFRNLVYFQKNGKRWIALQNVKRDARWLPVYERQPSLSSEILTKAKDALDQFLINLSPSAL